MSQSTISVLTFNILHGATTEGTFDLDRIARVIQEVEPDFVALQEVDYLTRRAKGYDLATELGQRCKMASVFARAMKYDGGEYGEALLSRHSFETTRRIPLPYTGNHEPRAAVEATVTLPGGDVIGVVGTHLDHASAADREAQARVLNAEVARENRPTILAGDFNATPGSETIRILEGRWGIAGGDDAEPTFPSDSPKIKIDYVMYTPRARWRVLETKVICDTVASDHCAYLVTLRLLPPGNR